MENEGYRETSPLRSGPAPLLSVVVPAYNVQRYLWAAVDSALAQTFRDLEVIVVDDGSTDETVNLIQEWCLRNDDPRLRILRQDNRGLSAARNTGIRAARGTFIGFLDGDDIWLPEKAERHMQALQRDPRIGISFSDSEYLAEDGRRTERYLQPRKPRPSLHDMIRRNHVGNGSAPIVRRACFEEAGFFREELKSCEDYEMWCRILWMTTYRAELIDAPLTLYRIRNSSLSFNFAKFLTNADAALTALRTAMPNVPERVFRTGHAEHYRIAAWKAVSSGQKAAGRKLLMHALRLRPVLAVTDWRAMGTFFASLLPTSFRDRFLFWMKMFQKRHMGRRPHVHGPIHSA